MYKCKNFLIFMATFFLHEKAHSMEEAYLVDMPQYDLDHRYFPSIPKKSSNFVEEPLPETLMKKVENPEEWPWIVNGQLRITYENDCNYISGGTIISDHCVLTTAQALCKDELIPPKKVSFFVGLKNGEAATIKMGDQYIYEFKARSIAINLQYIKACEAGCNNEQEKWGSDFAIVYFNEKLGYLGTALLDVLEEQNLKNLPIRINGYPSYLQQDNNIPSQESFIYLAPSQRSLYTMTGIIKEIGEGYIHYDVVTTPGLSGSAVLKENTDGEPVPHCIAIHSYGPHKRGNIGTLITQPKLAIIKDWIHYFENGVSLR